LYPNTSTEIYGGMGGGGGGGNVQSQKLRFKIEYLLIIDVKEKRVILIGRILFLY